MYIKHFTEPSNNHRKWSLITWDVVTLLKLLQESNNLDLVNYSIEYWSFQTLESILNDEDAVALFSPWQTKSAWKLNPAPAKDNRPVTPIIFSATGGRMRTTDLILITLSYIPQINKQWKEMKSCQLQLNMISHVLSIQFCTHIFDKLCHAQLNRGSAQM